MASRRHVTAEKAINLPPGLIGLKQHVNERGVLTGTKLVCLQSARRQKEARVLLCLYENTERCVCARR